MASGITVQQRFHETSPFHWQFSQLRKGTFMYRRIADYFRKLTNARFDLEGNHPGIICANATCSQEACLHTNIAPET